MISPPIALDVGTQSLCDQGLDERHNLSVLWFVVDRREQRRRLGEIEVPQACVEQSVQDPNAGGGRIPSARIVGAHGQVWKLSPQPQRPFSLGLRKVKPSRKGDRS